MKNENLANAFATAVAGITRDSADPLLKQCAIPPAHAENAYTSLFRSMAYFLKYRVKEAKESPIKKYGVYVQSLDRFLFGAYITIIENDGEESVVLDYTFDAADFAGIIEAGCAITTDEPQFAPFSSASTRDLENADGTRASFHILSEYQHTVYVYAAEVLKHYIECLLDDNTADPSVTYEGLFTARGYLDENGNKKISIEKDELLKQMIKNDDLNAVDSIGDQ